MEKIRLTSPNGFIKYQDIQALVESLKGNPVKIGDGPAAVIGNEHR
jgi:hypothetical protein